MIRRAPALPLAMLLVMILPDLCPARQEEPPHQHGEEPAEAADTPGPWKTMLHGYAYLTWNRQAGPSGDRSFESQNHLMASASRGWGGGVIALLGTFTAEPVTIPEEGSPLLFQRGETFEGNLLVDRQHAHDLFVQLAVRWDRPLTDNTGLTLYAAPVGEPPVGPTVYVHRPSSSFNPMAPLSHHNLDSTHISSDVVAAGLRAGPVLLEGAAFHGREPDEVRYDIDQGPLDSYAGRLSWRPAPGLLLQVSAARREHPEELEEGNQTRQTASAEYVRSSTGGFLAATLAVGRNLLREGDEWGGLLEATWKVRRHHLYARIEGVERDLFELINKTLRPETVSPDETWVHAMSAGYVLGFPLDVNGRPVDLGIGAGVTVHRFDNSLDGIYGDAPVSGQLFVRVGYATQGAPDPGPHHH